MPEQHFHRDNHYVPQGYLKRWASAPKKLWVYRLLVAHPAVPCWKQVSVKGVAYHQHLYTRLVKGQETDAVEKWLEKAFETPAEEPLRKATTNARLTSDDWKPLIRFVAAQDVRTPARLIETLQRFEHAYIPALNQRLSEWVQQSKHAHKHGATLQATAREDSDDIPLRVTPRIIPDQEYGELKVEAVMGRGLWLSNMRHLLTHTAASLLKHKWTILLSPEGISWLTSDDPVIRLNYYGPGRYDFKGGWESYGSEVLLPLSPRHMLYTHIGKRPPQRGEVMPRDKALLIRRFIMEHAHRLIFAAEPDPEVLRLRPRCVNQEMVQEEKNQWERFHEEHAQAERSLMGQPTERSSIPPGIF